MIKYHIYYTLLLIFSAHTYTEIRIKIYDFLHRHLYILGVLQVSQVQVYPVEFEMVLHTLCDNHLHEGLDFHWVLERRLVYREVRTFNLLKYNKE